MRIFISAGEASGDLHAAALTREILSLAPDAEVFGMGGDALRSAGGEVIFDYKDNSVMGFVRSSGNYQTCFGSGMLFARLWWNGNRIFL